MEKLKISENLKHFSIRRLETADRKRKKLNIYNSLRVCTKLTMMPSGLLLGAGHQYKINTQPKAVI